ncbi:MAG TPA: alpha/beta hydrolase, partial [Gemmatales bacterium]|nr:alpha/beta hydrolase [Gemmatales bacterium]
AGLLAGERDPWVRCFVTDGMFGTINTMMVYMYKWIALYSTLSWLRPYLPPLFYRVLARVVLCIVAIRRRSMFPSMKYALGRLAPRPLLMIHGGNDSYIKLEIAEGLFNLAREPKEMWVVPGAKHNQAVVVEAEQYQQRLA